MMKNHRTVFLLLAIFVSGANLSADDLPRLPTELDPKRQTYSEQKTLPDLPAAYVSTSPENVGDGLEVGTLDLPGTREAVETLVADDKAGNYKNLDGLLLWKDGNLNIVMVATADNQKAIGLPLQAAMEHLIPLFKE